MGLDFTALIPYAGPVGCADAIHELELQSPPELMHAAKFQVQQGYPYASRRVRAEWIGAYDGELRPRRVDLPCLDASLALPQAFILTFGADGVCVYHVLRWREFLTEPVWWPVMLDACDALARMFRSDEYIVTRAASPLVLAFRDGASYRDAIEHARAEGEPEVAEIADMYFEIDDDHTWDSTGYWRTAVPGLARVT